MDWTGRLFLIGWVALVIGAVAVLVMPPAPVLHYSYNEEITRTEQVPVDAEALYGEIDPYVTARVREVVADELSSGSIAGAIATSSAAAAAQVEGRLGPRVNAIDVRVATLEPTVTTIDQRTTSMVKITQGLVSKVEPLRPIPAILCVMAWIGGLGVLAVVLGLGVWAFVCWRRNRDRSR